MVAGPVLAVVTSPVWGTRADHGGVLPAPLLRGLPAPVLAQIAITAHSDRSGPALGAMFAWRGRGHRGGAAGGFRLHAWLGSALTLVLVTFVYIFSGLLFFWLGRSRGFALAILAGAAAAGMAGLALRPRAKCQRETHISACGSMTCRPIPPAPCT